MFAPKLGRFLALMHLDTPVRGGIRLRVAVGDFFFVDSSQPVGIVIVRVRIKLAPEAGKMLVEFRESLFPPERHYDMLIHERGIGHDARFLVRPLIERNG